ncbi:HAMP domain-containing histidine kinase [Mobilitalea sibirica]|uniref:histidine kinase n=1 Tax=Mobilitalea sibirica TaxID=1462919 RepID=A0A8J7KUS2_9FIRM|nr:HAMP domain-containing sensor histidine kinase [Mobilitalea sibirica]MBH1939325.1 HAMP domain-containing histidine kinase [Mobilitalea sibirica]
MFRVLQRRFTFIYTFTISLILTFVIIVVVYFMFNQTLLNTQATLTNVLNEVEYKLQVDKNINQVWLSTMSSKFDTMIHIEDNGKPLLYTNTIKSPTEYDTLVNKVKELALKKDINTSIYPISFDKKLSPLLKFRGDKYEPYYSYTSMLVSANGWQTIIIIKNVTDQHLILLRYAITAFVIDLLLILFVYSFSRYFVMKTLLPVVDAQQKQKEFIASASHELRSPLAVIRAIVSSLKLNVGTSKDNLQNEYLNDIEAEAVRMSTLINDLLVLASTQAHKWSIKKEALDTDALLLDLYEAFSILASKKGRKLSIHLPDKSLPCVLADKQRLWQALTVILDNALEYTPPGKDITLKAYTKKLKMYIEIIDHGVGIPDEQKELIFNNFYRADPSKNSKEHFGLGLSIAKELILLHDGKIYVQDTLGGGATFVIELPLE